MWAIWALQRLRCNEALKAAAVKHCKLTCHITVTLVRIMSMMLVRILISKRSGLFSGAYRVTRPCNMNCWLSRIYYLYCSQYRSWRSCRAYIVLLEKILLLFTMSAGQFLRTAKNGVNIYLRLERNDFKRLPVAEDQAALLGRELLKSMRKMPLRIRSLKTRQKG